MRFGAEQIEGPIELPGNSSTTTYLVRVSHVREMKLFVHVYRYVGKRFPSTMRFGAERGEGPKRMMRGKFSNIYIYTEPKFNVFLQSIMHLLYETNTLVCLAVGVVDFYLNN